MPAGGLTVSAVGEVKTSAARGRNVFSSGWGMTGCVLNTGSSAETGDFLFRSISPGDKLPLFDVLSNFGLTGSFGLTTEGVRMSGLTVGSGSAPNNST